ncbi:polysaccharide deacetylase family protein [Pseudofrankia sp. DC12]|uniref:polysaccharide deacetylase family protein n=1 Tax=Pseudofrankia sp. DC12 TaxID=683315 RepID=UPI000696AC8B|nr:polysaccharide deacetylase family protein [Pseudofrankia sp. DC12]
MYHSVGRGASSAFRRWQVDPGLFADQLGTLVDAGYRLVGLSAALDEPDDRTVAVTFDDGFVDFLGATEQLVAAGCGATLYVPTAHVARKAGWMAGYREAELRIMDWPQIAEVAAAGIEIGSHGHAHAELDLMPAHLMRSDIVRSRRLLSDRLARPVRSFCYPFGYHTRTVRSAVAEAGFANACEVGYGLHPRAGDPFAVRRLIVTGDTRPADLHRLIIAGQDSPVMQLRRRTRTPWRLYRAAHQIATRGRPGAEAGEDADR